MPLTDLITTLQLSIGPVILISGVGLILLSMTNRLARVIDRTFILAELRILSKRANLARAGIALAVISVLLTSLLIISLFLGAMLQIDIAAFIVTLFILCMLSLVASLLFFLADINLALKALWFEIPPEVRIR